MMNIVVLLIMAMAGCSKHPFTEALSGDSPNFAAHFDQPTRITIGNESSFGPSLSPNGAYVFFSSDRNGNQDIFVKKTKGGFPAALTQHSADDFAPSISPDGTKLAFVSKRRNAAGAIHILDVSNISVRGQGSPEKVLSTIDIPELENRNPAWFPGSDQLLFAGRKIGDKTSNLYISNIKNPPEIDSFNHLQGDYPSVSHDGSMVVYSRNGLLFLYNMVTHQESKLTNGTYAEDGHPTFSEDDKEVYFIRFADDTNGDGIIDANDRPSLWSLKVAYQLANPDNLENFQLLQVSSASTSAFYPKHHAPFIYFATEDAESLDIFRLPETGHTKSHSTLAETLSVFDEVTDDYDKLYVLSHDSAQAARRGEFDLTAQLVIRQLEWMIESEKYLEAEHFASKISSNFKNDLHTSTLVDLDLNEIEIAPFRYPDGTKDLDAGHRTKFEGRLKRINQLLSSVTSSHQKSAKNEEIAGKALFLKAEILATLGRVEESLSILSTIHRHYQQDPHLAAVALFYQSKIEAATGKVEEASTTVITMIKDYPDERTRAMVASLELTATYDESNPKSIPSLYKLKDKAQDVPILNAYIQKRIVQILEHQGKNEAAKSELRTLISRGRGAPNVVIEAANDLIAKEEYEGRYAAIAGILTDLRESVSHDSPEDRQQANNVEATYHVRRGRYYFGQGDTISARNEYQLALETNPTNLSAREGLIDVAFAQQEGETIIAARRSSLAISADSDGESHYLLCYAIQKERPRKDSASIDQRLKIVNECLTLLESARDMDGHVAQYHIQLGKLYLEKAHLISAENFRANGNPKNDGTWAKIASFFGQTDPNLFELSIDSSLAAYHLTESGTVERADLALQLGNTYFENQNYHLSMTYYATRIVMLDTVPMASERETMLLFRHAGRAAFFSDELALAEAFQNRALQSANKASEDAESEIDQAYAMDALALTMRMEKKYHQAQILYEKLLPIFAKRGHQDNMIGTRINLGYCHLMLNQADEAVAQYDAANDLLNQKDSSDTTSEKNAIQIDLGGQHSAAFGFSNEDRRIQMASFKARIFEQKGELPKAIESLNERIALLEKKRSAGLGAKLSPVYLSEELSISFNNLGFLNTKLQNLDVATTSFTAAMTYGANLRDKNQKFAPRPVWMNLLNLSRVQLQRADINALPDGEKTKLIDNIKHELDELAGPAAMGNREAMLALAELDASYAQLLTIRINHGDQEILPSQENEAEAQVRFQESILLSQKLGIDSPFSKAANLNLKREAVHDGPEKDDVFSSQMDFRRVALTTPQLLWKYLATRQLCQPALLQAREFVEGGGEILGHDHKLLKHCVDQLLTQKAAEPKTVTLVDDELNLMRQYSYLVEKSAAPVGQIERVFAALDHGDGLVTIHITHDGKIFTVVTHDQKNEALKQFNVQKTEDVMPSEWIKAANQVLLDSKIARLYIAREGTHYDSKLKPWVDELIKKNRLQVAMIPSPDYLAKMAITRPMSVDWDMKTGQFTFDHDYLGPSRQAIKIDPDRYLERSLRQSQESARDGNQKLAVKFAKEAFYFSEMMQTSESILRATNALIDHLIQAGDNQDMSYFLAEKDRVEKILGADHSLERDLDLIKLEVKSDHLDNADGRLKAIKSKIMASKESMTTGRYYEMMGFLEQKRLQNLSSLKYISEARKVYSVLKSTPDVVRMDLWIGREAINMNGDFKLASEHLAAADRLLKDAAPDRHELLRAKLDYIDSELKFGRVKQAQKDLQALLVHPHFALKDDETTDIKIKIAGTEYQLGHVSESALLLNDLNAKINQITNGEIKSKLKVKIRSGLAKILAIDGEKSEAVRLFNTVILEATETAQKPLEYDVRHEFALWLLKWGEFSQAATQFDHNLNLLSASAKFGNYKYELAMEGAYFVLSQMLAGKYADSRSESAHRLADAKSSNSPPAVVFNLLVATDIAIANHDWKLASAHLEEALHLSEVSHVDDLVWRIYFGQALVLHATSNHRMVLEKAQSAYAAKAKNQDGPVDPFFPSSTITLASEPHLTEELVSDLIENGSTDQAWVIHQTERAHGLRENFPRFAAHGDTKVDGLKSRLRPTDVVVDFAIGLNQSFAFVMTRSELRAVKIETNIKNLYNLCGYDTQQNVKSSPANIDELSRILIEPLKLSSRPSGFEKIYLSIIDQEPLRFVPFAALMVRRQPLFENYRLSFTTSEQFLIPPKANSILTDRRSPSPQSDPKLAKVVSVIAPSTELNYSLKERVILPRYFPDAQIINTKVLNPEVWATESQSVDIVHLAASVAINQQQPLLSRMKFFNPGKAPFTLSPPSIGDTKNAAPLVVLSQPTSSQIFAAAFQVAGSEHIVINMASQHDVTNSFLVKNFYKVLVSGKGNCAALYEAQLAASRIDTDPESWANFRIYGNCETF